MKLNREVVERNIRGTRRPVFQVGDLVETVRSLKNRLHPSEQRTYQPRLDEACRFLQQHYGGLGAVDATLIDLAAEMFYAGLCEADGGPYAPANARIGALLIQVKERMLRAVAPEGEDLRTPQANGENGVTQV